MKKKENVILVGKKPTMSYVLAVMTQFNNGNDEVVLKARGKSISRAVDVVEAVKNKFMKDIKPIVTVGTEKVTSKDGNQLNVSTVDILIKKV